MARAGAMYPQVEPGAIALIAELVTAGSAGARADRALDTCRRSGAHALALGPRAIVRQADLERAVAWGLGHAPTRLLAWTALPTVAATASEIDVRRQLLAGAPMVLVRNGRRAVGIVDRQSAGMTRPHLSVVAQLERMTSPEGAAQLQLLRVAGEVGNDLGAPAFAVGGFVRDLLAGRSSVDVDLLVEGDGVAFAQRLAERIGGRLSTHAAFGTASIENAVAVDGRPLGRVDVASARRERYDAPGALPVVSFATLADDLSRRDFSVNAMALALAPSAFGALVDPCGGRHDLQRRRLRPLHPLSFVEDPTRIFRAARYAPRLGLRLTADGRTALRLALHLGGYPALSGQRLRAELDLLAREPRPERGLALILRWNALKLWHRSYRSAGATPRRAADGARLLRWARARGIRLDPADVLLVALLDEQTPRVRRACLDRLAIGGRPRAHAEAAAAPTVSRRLETARRRSDAADILRPLPDIVVTGTWLRSGPRARRHIEWYLAEGRLARPLLSGEDLMRAGVPLGPAVGACLSALRRAQVDGVVRSIAQERAFVRGWLGDTRPRGIPARKEA